LHETPPSRLALFPVTPAETAQNVPNQPIAWKTAAQAPDSFQPSAFSYQRAESRVHPEVEKHTSAS